MSSRLSNRTKKQEKYRRHVASLTSSASGKDDENEDRNVSESHSRSPSPPYNPIKGTRYVSQTSEQQEPKEPRNEGKKTDFKARYRKHIVNRRTGRSLTRSTSRNSSRASSASSKASSNGSGSEPGRIMPRPRPGRSLTRSDSGRALPTSRSLSASKPPAIVTNPSDTSAGPLVASASEEPSVASILTHRARSSSTSRDPEHPKTAGESSEIATTPNSAKLNPNSPLNLRPLSRRSPFAKLLAEKQSSVGSVKKSLSGKSKYNVKSTKPKEDTTTAATSPPVEEKPSVAESDEDLPSDEEPTKKAFLSQDNVEKHTNEATTTTEDDFADPELEEMESEVTVNTDLAVENYLAENSLLAKLGTSPVHEVTSPVSEAASSVQEPNEKSIEGEDGKPVLPAVDSGANEEKKETDDDDDTVPPALKAWDMANPKFANFTPSQDEEFEPVEFDKDVWDPESRFSKSADTSDDKDNEDASENAEGEAGESPDAPVEPAKESPKNKKSSEEYDMFDTSSWAAGTLSDFSNTPFSKIEMGISADRNFVKMMNEEMKFRSLTEEEQKLMFEANEKIAQYEEREKEELNTVQKDDEPLVAKRSDSEGNTDVASLEDRVKMYSTVEPDSDSANSNEESDDQESSGDETDAKVDYVDQINAEDEEIPDITGAGTEEEPIDLVASQDVPTLQVAAAAASAQEIPVIPRTLSELKQSGAPPPPPPPGQPKKKKKKKKKKSKTGTTSEQKKVPLIPPPSEEKLKNWKGNQTDAKDFVSAMAEKLADTATKTLDASSEYFKSFSKEEDDGDDSVAAFAKKVQLENEKAVAETTEKNNLWKREVDDAMGLVERLEEEYDKEKFPEISMFPSPLSEDEIARKASEEQSAAVAIVSQDNDGEDKKTLTVDVLSSPKDREESIFTSPKSAKATKSPTNEKTKVSSSAEITLTSPKMADKFAMASSAAANTFEQTFTPRNSSNDPKTFDSLAWFTREVLQKEFNGEASEVDVSTAAQLLLEDIGNFNAMCRTLAESVNEVSLEMQPSLKTSESFDTAALMSRSLSSVASGDPLLSRTGTMSTAASVDSDDKPLGPKRILLRPVILSDASVKLSGKYLAANFVSFLFMASKLAKVPSPFGDKNPFLAMIVESSMETIGVQPSQTSTQELIFEQLDGKVEKLLQFAHKVKNACDAEMKALKQKPGDSIFEIEQGKQSIDEAEISTVFDSGKRFIVPESHPSPFESTIADAPRIVAAVLSFLGDPVAVCTMKKVNQECRRIVSENEHTLMQDAVRSGGLESKNRPAFWMHVALEKSDTDDRVNTFNGIEELKKLELSAEEEKWHHVIKRDVERSFGNMPPHKMGAKFRSDSIVAALVTWGQSRLMKRGVKGGGEPVPIPEIDGEEQKGKPQATNLSSPPWSDESKEDSHAENIEALSPEEADDRSETPVDASMEEIALCGNSLSAEEKADLQNKLSFILHTLAASYEDIGYCQGMDYVVAHLLRNIQDTIRSKAANKDLPAIISTASELNVTEDIELLNKDIDSNHVVEETIVRMMDTFFVNYNLKHMYYPELRCLKTCCRVFERLIQIKLPVLADHFEHHDLNVGLFALGWFQTLFLYLPSMPSATVDHIWDIWLVERSFKIFFRVGTAILFLSQPILLNHELEGMMTYLNTIPDATLLRPDILIPCALNIKITNRLLQELEDEVMQNPN